MIGAGHPTESFRRLESDAYVARFARAEYGDGGTAWMAVGASPVKGKWRFAGLARAWRGFRRTAARIAAMLF